MWDYMALLIDSTKCKMPLPKLEISSYESLIGTNSLKADIFFDRFLHFHAKHILQIVIIWFLAKRKSLGNKEFHLRMPHTGAGLIEQIL